MILDISVENWLSFRDNILLNLSEEKNVLIYGNDKEDIFKILLLVREMLKKSESISNREKLPVQSFLFFNQSKISKFKIHFIYNGIRYLYGFKVKCDKVIQEYLYYYENDRQKKIFLRKDTVCYSFSKKYASVMIPYIKLVWDNKLFLGILGHHKCDIVLDVYQFLTQKLVFMQDMKIKYSKKFSQFMKPYFKLIDYDISDYKTYKNQVLLEHKIDNNIYLVNLDDENASVRNLFNLLYFIYSNIGNTMFILNLFDYMNPLVVGKILDECDCQFIIGSNNLELCNIKSFNNKQVLMCDIDTKNGYKGVIYNIGNK